MNKKDNKQAMHDSLKIEEVFVSRHTISKKQILNQDLHDGINQVYIKHITFSSFRKNIYIVI